MSFPLLVFPPLFRSLFFFSTDTYHVENIKPLKTAQPPSFSFGSRTKYLKKDNIPSPSTYTLPAMIGPRVINKKSGSAPSMTGRSLIGSFHQDFRKVNKRENE